MGKPHPALDYFTNGAGEKTTTDEKVEQVAEVRRNSTVYPTLNSAFLLPCKLQFFPVRQFLEAVCSGKLSKCDKRFWSRRCSSNQSPKSSLLPQALAIPFPWSVLLKKTKISKLHCVYCACAFCHFEIPTLVFLYGRSPE